ncbi:hypothetical protein BDZ94DRAFT_204 [Collybia nuda]|uniref:Uncharacterized protein n=1 Tax=Collybia nuda TaxID=64659 RepID=A0A9P5YGF5_9AGAR|nr:hypothetical protein BDZ94DRAFT_204 [Collybia nuda]
MSFPSQGLSVLLVNHGESLINTVVETCTFTLVYGIFVLLFGQATVIYFKKKQPSQAQRWMFATSIISFVLATAFEAALLILTKVSVDSVTSRSKDPRVSLVPRHLFVNHSSVRANYLCMWIAGLETIISDIIVVWRVYVLSLHRRRFMVVPLFLLLSSLVFLLVSWIMSTSGVSNTQRIMILNNVGFGLSLATNATATGLIGCIYWRHRSETAAFGKCGPRQVERILALLVESGIVFCLLQAISFGLQFTPELHIPDVAHSLAIDVFGGLYQGFTAMYPTIMIALVNSHCTFDHIYSANPSLPTISHGPKPKSMTTMRFAEPESVPNASIYPQSFQNKKSAREA